MTPTHESIIAAIDWSSASSRRQEHCADLRATAELHKPYVAHGANGCELCRQPRPCQTMQVVIARLQSWGYLTERTEP